jgi:nucleoside-diphosphate-sugar epimerase
VESVVNATLSGQVQVGSLDTSRRYVHVDDVCRAILKAASQTSGSGRIWNVAGHCDVSLREIIQLTEQHSGHHASVQESNPSGLNARRPSSVLIAAELGWVPEVDMSTGVQELVEYFTDA